MSRTIVVKNHSTVVSDLEIRRVLPALQKQLNLDFAPYYGGAGHLHFVHVESDAPGDAFLLQFFDDADQAGALGYHDLGSEGQPLSKVFCKTTMDDGALWTVCASHELLEMSADPNINLCAFDEEHGRLYCFEVCDAPEADAFGYETDGVRVSDFVLPGWFEPTHVAKGERFAFKSPLTAPFQLMPGGYISFWNIAKRRWDQVTMARSSGRPELVSARDVHHDTAHPLARIEALADVKSRRGTRRARRLTPRSQWKRSTAV